MIRIGVDIMGGDYAPLETTLGAIAALNDLSPQEVHLVLIGDEKIITEIIEGQGVNPRLFTIVNATEVIEMSDSATRAFSQKPNSGMAIGLVC